MVANQPTALVHKAWLRSAGQPAWISRAHELARNVWPKLATTVTITAVNMKRPNAAELAPLVSPEFLEGSQALALLGERSDYAPCACC
jgi:hypothetical protein